MKIGFAGDWHGNAFFSTEALKAFAERDVSLVMHVGDFGIGWPGHGQTYARWIDQVCDELGLTIYITPGNHENWHYINNELEWNEGQAWIGNHLCVLARNLRFEIDGRSFLSLGGAPSIDFDQRTEGYSWWREEMLTLMDVERAAAQGYADIMLAHDAPPNGTDQVQRIIDGPKPPIFTDAGLAYAREGQALMKIAVDGVQPGMFVHGHFHVAGEKQVGPTRFISLDKDADRPGTKSRNGIMLDTETMEYEWLNILWPIRVDA